MTMAFMCVFMIVLGILLVLILNVMKLILQLITIHYSLSSLCLHIQLFFNMSMKMSHELITHCIILTVLSWNNLI